MYKRLFFLLLFAEALSFSSISNPGDTTWVTIMDTTKLTHYGDYDTVSTFPTGKRYRKIRLHYILGRYACPPTTVTPAYCGSWDYTTMLIARPAGKDTAEIARIITPYATNWLSQNKSHEYIVDVTDYASVLEGTTSMRFRYEGYSWGFTLILKLEFIEGVPPMDALAVKKIYDGYYQFGNNANPIENYLTAKSFTYSAPTSSVFIKNTVSGHGYDNNANQCAEFCSKYYNLKINNNQVAQTQLWRSDCGINEVYPQTGTWVYDRANWCPGAIVIPIYHDISNLVTPSTTFSVNIDMEPYSTPTNWGGYNWVSQLIHYSAPNHTRDVSIEDIVAPTKDPNFFRENPACINPIVRIRNTGTNPITEIVFSYGLAGKTPLTFTWTGSLHFLHDTDAVFPNSNSVFTNTVATPFEVSIISVNGVTGDNNLLNNTYRSIAPPVTIFPESFVIKTFTNKATDNNGDSETSWTVYDETGAPVYSRNTLSTTTLYKDTVIGLPAGCYKIVVNDFGCDGLAWWANTAAGNGYMRFDRIDANNTVYNFPVDFGCNFTKYFNIVNTNPNTVGISKAGDSKNKISVYPNPASSTADLRIDLAKSQDVTLTISDVNGKKISVKQIHINHGVEKLNLSEYPSGVYLLSVQLEDKTLINKKLLVQK